MTERSHSITVTLEKDVRVDDAESLILAIRMMRGVLDVRGNVTTSEIHTAEHRLSSEVVLSMYALAGAFSKHGTRATAAMLEEFSKKKVVEP